MKWFWATAFFLISNVPSHAAAPEAKELVRRVETLYQGKTSHAIGTLKVTTPSWSREMRLEMWSEGRDKFIAKILAPKKDAGTATLKVGDEMWNFIPRIDRLMKIPSSLMGDRWMGSNLTNDDLVKEVKIDQLYDFRTVRNEGDVTVLEGIPKPAAAVVWGKIVYTIDTAKMVPEKTEYFDEDGKLVRTLAFEDVTRVGERWVPMRMRVIPADKPGESTVLTYEKLEFDVPLSKERFSVQSLRAR